MGPFQKALRSLYPEWLPGGIPRRGKPDTRARLRKRIVQLWEALEIPERKGWMEWDERRLYAEFFEREAELKCRTDHPDLYEKVAGKTARLRQGSFFA